MFRLAFHSSLPGFALTDLQIIVQWLFDARAAATAGGVLRPSLNECFSSLVKVVANSLISRYWSLATPLKCCRVSLTGHHTSTDMECASCPSPMFCSMGIGAERTRLPDSPVNESRRGIAVLHGDFDFCPDC